MPINFEPAAPTGNAAAASYGAAQQNAQDIGATANLYEAAARMQMQNQQLQQAGQEAQQRGNAAATAAQLEDRHQQQAFAGQQDQTALGYAALQARGEEIDRHAQAQAWVSKQDMTYADQLRMNRMQQGVSEVEDAFRNKKIDQDTYTAAVMQIRTGLDPLKMKYERQQSDHMAQESKMLDAKMTQMAAHDAAYEQFRVEAAARGQTIAMIPDGRGGLHGPFAFNRNTGELYRPGVAGGEGAQDKVQGQQQQFAYKAGQDAGKAWDAAYEKAKALVQKWKMETVKGADGKVTRLHPELDNTDKFHEIVDGQMRRGQMGTDRDAYVRGQTAALPKRLGAAGGAGGDLGGGGDYGGDQPAAAPPPAPAPTPEQVQQRREQVAREQPPVTDPEKATPDQKKVLARLGQFKGFAQATPLPAGEREWAVKEIEEGEKLYRQFGSVEGMPEAAAKRFSEVQQMLARLAAEHDKFAAARQAQVAGQGTALQRGWARLRGVATGAGDPTPNPAPRPGAGGFGL